MTDTIELTGVTDGWIKVDLPDGTTEYVATVKICGTELEMEAPMTAKLTCEEYSFVRDYHPALLVEVPSWYTPPRE